MNTGSGYGIIKIRTADENTENEERNGKIIIKEDTYLKKEFEIKVTQAGRLSVIPNKIESVADGFACDWKFGSDVNVLYVKVFAKEPTSSELNWTYIKRKWQNFIADNQLVIGWGGLMENTKYKILCVGADNDGNHIKSISGYNIWTGSSEDQPIAQIINPIIKDDKWLWSVSMNEAASWYYQMIFPRKEIDNMPDSYIAWHIHNSAEEESLAKETNSSCWTYPYISDICIATYAGNDLVGFSDIICRYSLGNEEKKYLSFPGSDKAFVGYKKQFLPFKMNIKKYK